MRTSRCHLSIVFVACLVALSPTVARAQPGPPAYRDKGRTADERVADLLPRLTLDEKIALLSGQGFEGTGIPRLGIPGLKMTDGPNGVRWGKSATAFPTGIAMVATWDPQALAGAARAMAIETKAKGRHVLLAPCVNIGRVPHNGRNFECFGEDPYLSGRMAVSYIRAVQQEGVIATVKHFAANNQEHRRMDIDVRVDERALHEVYFPQFRAAVEEGGVWAVMAAYNKVNGLWATENKFLIKDVLKGQWGFKGILMSDWDATHHTLEAALAGLDLEMPDGKFTGVKLLSPLVKEGKLPQAEIDDKVRRILWVTFVSGAFDRVVKEEPALIGAQAHRDASLALARGVMTLLKNERGALPLIPGAGPGAAVKTVAVIGPGAIFPRVAGGGSAFVVPTVAVKPLDALRAQLPGVAVNYAQGFVVPGDVSPVPAAALSHKEGAASKPGVVAEYFANEKLEGTPALKRVETDLDLDWSDGSPGKRVPAERFSGRFTFQLTPEAAGLHHLTASANDGFRLFVEGKLVLDGWGGLKADKAVAEIVLEKRPYDVVIEHHEGTGTARLRFDWARPEHAKKEDAVAIAKSADAAIVFAGLSANYEKEGADHAELSLPKEQEDVIRAVAKVNKRTIVVLNNGSPLFIESWLKDVPAVIEAWYPGQEGGTAIAEALSGALNPSGRLPVTFLRAWKDSPAFGTYPEAEGGAPYREGIFVGYRGADAKKVKVTFPFGHGLSYTTFKYSGLQIAENSGAWDVSFDVQNTGKRNGAEVVQLYVGEKKPSVPRPPRELKGFQKVTLAAGETQRIKMTVNGAALSFWDPTAKGWTSRPGDFEIAVGSSSRDLRLRGTLLAAGAAH